MTDEQVLANWDSTDPTPVRDRWRTILDRATDWQPPEIATVIVVPHPDDEVLIAGGLIRCQRDRGVPVEIVAVTDGEAAYATDDEVRRRRLAARRRQEQLAALEDLGVSRTSVERLGIPDGAVGEHVEQLAGWIAGEYPDHLVVAPWVEDHHPDHEACGRAATTACRSGGHPLAYGFFWTWHHADPADLDGSQLSRLGLPARVRRRRSRAMDHHRTQLDRPDGQPVLDRGLIEPVRWSAEFYMVDMALARRRSIVPHAAAVHREAS